MNNQNSNRGGAIQPLPLKGDNLDNAVFYISIASEKEKKDRTRAIAKAIYFLNNELKEIATQ
jgi:hypothetical protein